MSNLAKNYKRFAITWLVAAVVAAVVSATWLVFWPESAMRERMLLNHFCQVVTFQGGVRGNTTVYRCGDGFYYGVEEGK